MNERRSRTLASRNELCGPSSCTPEHAAALLKSNSGTTMNFSACFYERQDVIFGMNAISHVPEPYLDPVLLIGGRRVARTPFKRSSYKIVTDQQKNTLPNLVLRGTYACGWYKCMINSYTFRVYGLLCINFLLVVLAQWRRIWKILTRWAI